MTTAGASSASAATRPTRPRRATRARRRCASTTTRTARHRLTSPLRRRPDGTFEEIDWDTAIARGRRRASPRCATPTAASRSSTTAAAARGTTSAAPTAGRRCGPSAPATARTPWPRRRPASSGSTPGCSARMVRGDFEHAEVALFVGKNPWQSHGFPHARTTLKEIARDPERSLIVIDPRRTETAELADFHLPGAARHRRLAASPRWWRSSCRRAWSTGRGWPSTPSGWTRSRRRSGALDVAAYAAICGVARGRCCAPTARRIAARRERRRVRGPRHPDEPALHAGQLPREAGLGADRQLRQARRAVRADRRWWRWPAATSAGRRRGGAPVSPVAGARIIGGLVPCNVIADEILTDHPARYRAMLVESGNPAHSLADSSRMREALDALDLVVVIDVAMTETARLADYVLPAPSQYEKWEATFFNFEFPDNVFHLRRPVLPAPDGAAARAGDPRPARRGARALVDRGRPRAAARPPPSAAGPQFAEAFFAATAANPTLGALAPIVLYRTLGPTLPDGAASAAILWGAAHRCAHVVPGLGAPGRLRRRGPGARRARCSTPSSPARPASVFTVDEYEDSWRRVAHRRRPRPPGHPRAARRAGHAWHEPPAVDARLPVRALGRRAAVVHGQHDLPRPDLAQARRRRCAAAAARPTPSALGVADGGRARLTTQRGDGRGPGRGHDVMQPGHVSLPNGMGVDYPAEDGPRGRGRGAQRADRRRGPRLAGRDAVAQARAGPARGRSGERQGRGAATSDVDPAALEWLERYAAAIGCRRPAWRRSTALLALAGTAAHASHRQAAPVACWLAARPGLTPAEALDRADDLGG